METLNDHYINATDLFLDEFAVEEIIDAVTDYQNLRVNFYQLCGDINNIINDYIIRFIPQIILENDDDDE